MSNSNATLSSRVIASKSLMRCIVAAMLTALLSGACIIVEPPDDSSSSGDNNTHEPSNNDVPDLSNDSNNGGDEPVENSALNNDLVPDLNNTVNNDIPDENNSSPDVPVEDYACTTGHDISVFAAPELIEFLDEENKALYLRRFEMVSADEAYGTRGNAYEFDLWHTGDGGESFSLVDTVNTGNTGMSARYRFYAYPNELWYVTAFSGAGYGGTAGISYDGGRTWESIEDTVHQLYDGYRWPVQSLGRVRDRGMHILSMGESGNSLAISRDGAISWERADQPAGVRSLQLFATNNNLMARGLTSTSTMDWEVFRYDFQDEQFVALRGHLPEDFWSDDVLNPVAFTNTVTLLDKESQRTPERSALFTTDNGNSFNVLYRHERSGDEEGFMLSRALARDAALGFITEQSSNRTRIRATCDGGQSWKTIFEASNTTHTYDIISDLNGQIYAVRSSAAGLSALMPLTK